MDLSRVENDLTIIIRADGTVTFGFGSHSIRDDGTLARDDDAPWFSASGVDRLIGGSGDDTFIFEGEAPDALTLDGGEGADTLLMLGTDTTWFISAADAGTVRNVQFRGIENLTGGIDNSDTFVLGANGALSGVMDGNAGGFDTLVLDGGAFETLSYAAISPHAGTIRLDDRLVTYDGLEPIIDNTVTTHRVIDMTSGKDLDAVLSAVADGRLMLSGTTFESITFTKPTASLTIRGIGGTDAVTIQTLDLGATALVVEAETIRVLAGQTLTSLADITFDATAAVSVGTGNTVTASLSAQVLVEGTIRTGGALVLKATADETIVLSSFLGSASIDSTTLASAIIGGGATIEARALAVVATTAVTLETTATGVTVSVLDITSNQTTIAGIRDGASITVGTAALAARR
ncbi:MAG: parallel beta-helix repeat-containing protein [Rhodospirillaceae bacterium]|nr:MAG: parallel beta-helix repeat-containing protein [Rhodospirillaceae bacterium]